VRLPTDRHPGTRPARAKARTPLRIGVLVGDDVRLENWQLWLFDKLLADPRFDLAALIVHQNPCGERTSRLVDLVCQADRLLFARQPPYRTSRFDDARRKITRIDLSEKDAAVRIGDAGLDLVLRHVPAPLPKELVATLPFGEWTLSFTALQSPTADWTGLAEVIAHAAAIDVHLTVDRGRGAAPERVASASFNPKISAARTAAFVKEKAVVLLMRELARLAETRTLEVLPPLPARIGQRPPTGAEIGTYAAQLVRSTSRLALKTLRRKAGLEAAVWTLYGGSGSVEDFDPRLSAEIPPTRASIRADPFLFIHEGQCYVFYEDYAVSDRKAHIGVGRLSGNTIEPLGTAIEGDSHLSFPFVFRHGRDIFMMPETHQKHRIEIWRCIDFPLKWELHATALEGSSPADSTLFRHQGRWWLLTNLSDHFAFEDHCSELYAFEVDGPKLSRVVPHARNPVVIGSSVARNAGRVFNRSGRLFRPSQNNAYGVYGYGLNIMEIQELSHEAYRETCVRTIRPDFKPGLVGCHHFDSDGGRYILDARLTS